MRDLTDVEIERLLERGKIARLGVYDYEHRRAYVVPVSYYFRDHAAYLHTAPGLKLELLHEQPDHVCFEVDEIADEGEWQSVIGWGHFEEIPEPEERQRVLRAFGERLQRGPLRAHSQAGRAGVLGAGETVYRIQLEERTGRADTTGWTARESN